MSGSLESALIAAIRSAVAADPVLSATLNRLGDSAGERAPVPAAWFGERIASAWGTKDHAGQQLRLSLIIIDRGGGARIDALTAAVAALVPTLPSALDGWTTGGTQVLRTRTTQRRDGMRQALIELQVRGWPEA